MILGGSGFIGNALYKELHPYFDTHATYYSDNPFFEKNQKFHQYDLEQESISILLENLRPNIIISTLRGNFDAQVHTHLEIIDYLLRTKNTKLIFISSANVFDAFTNFPSYEYDKTLSQSVYGRFKIKIENALLRLPNHKYVIARLPMVYGANSPRVLEIKKQLQENEAIEVFSNVVVNATSDIKFTQQLHYIINQNKQGVFHLGSTDLVHHNDMVSEICKTLGEEKPFLKNVFDSNFDRFLAVLPKDNLLPKNLQVTVQEVVESCIVV